MKTQIKGFTNIKTNNAKVAPNHTIKPDEVNLLFLDKNYRASFKEQDKLKSLFYNKTVLLSLLIACLVGSFVCLQIEYGFVKAFLILGSFILAFRGLAWSFRELKNNL